ncbi:MAG: 4Fe-4S binding protein, partial [Pseudomonadota bacterium]
HQSFCTKVLYPHSECRRCLTVCPTNAIQFEDRTLKISSNCMGCEFCIPSCPNEVFSIITDNQENLKEKNKQVRVYCSKLLQEETGISRPLPSSIIPCLGSISVHFIINWFIERESPLEVVIGSCPDCSMKDGRTYFEKRESDITTIFSYLNIDIRPVVIRVAREEDIQNAKQFYMAFNRGKDEATALSRRDFILKFRSPILFTQRDVGKAAKQRKDRGPNAPDATEQLGSLVKLFKKYKGYVSSGEVIPGFSEIEIDKTCTGCGACANLCPTGALRLKQFQSDAELAWTLTRCTQCELCAAVCTKNAVRFIPVCDSKAIMSETQRAVKHLYRHTCPECRREYISNRPEASCVHCHKEARTMDDVSRMIYGQGLQGDSFDEHR